MDSKVHIIIAADEGRMRSLAVSKKRLRIMVAAAVVVASVVVVSLCYSGLMLLNMPARQQRLASLEARVQSLQGRNKNLVIQVDNYQREREQQMCSALGRLNERSAQLESILTRVGVVLPDSTEVDADGALQTDIAVGDGSNSGGPFIAYAAGESPAPRANTASKNVITYSDRLLDLARHVPLGIPSQGYFSSGFGRRTDPINGKKAFHSGIDIAANVGTKVHATADGVVASCGYNGGYGNMVKLKNNSRFTTLFGHLQKILVKRGEMVTRGDVIGTMGNSGRSTGPHLHYEIHDRGRAVNPYRFTFL